MIVIGRLHFAELSILVGELIVSWKSFASGRLQQAAARRRNLFGRFRNEIFEITNAFRKMLDMVLE